MAEYVKEFDRGCHFSPLIVNDPVVKLQHFLDGLSPSIRRDVLMADPKYYAAAIKRAFMLEQTLKDIRFEAQRKRPFHQSQQQAQAKRPFTGQQSGQGSRTPQNTLPMLNILSSVSVRESRTQYFCDPQWFRDTASRGPTIIVAPESQFQTCPSDHDSIGYPRMSASGESSTRCIDSYMPYMHRGLTQFRRLMTPIVRTNQYNQDLGLIHSTNGNHLESPNEGSSIDHQVTIHLHAQNITMFPTNEHGTSHRRY
ncbi:hypothetical protein F511_42676 [Dorcoceras hygrometricum]|uniref:Uncharacterized protein n=1 Tax=Dorcoceras hygrometricum TaxID=472368 RepID=A0A2Z7BZ68_9LAMI|nr:hypothetical protein F511_42676 [Dorcoceras hygrometricum]